MTGHAEDAGHADGVDRPEAGGSNDASAVNASNAAVGGVEGLLAVVKERGFVTTGEIFAAFPGLEPETAELAAIYSGISAQGVQVVDEIAEELEREDQRRGAPEARPPHRARTSESGRSSGVAALCSQIPDRSG